MAYIGFRKGVAAIRVIERFELDGIEFALQEVRRFDDPDVVFRRFIEAEIVTSEADVTAATAQIRDALTKYGLQEIAKDDWKAFIKFLNNEANGVFDYDDTPNWDLLERLGR